MVADSGCHFDGSQLIAVGHPNMAFVALFVRFDSFGDRKLGFVFLAVVVAGGRLLLSFENVLVLLPYPILLGVEPQRRIGNPQHVLLVLDLKRQRGGHSREQFEFRVGGRDDDRIGDDILSLGGTESDLLDLADEDLVGVGIDLEANGLFPLGGIADATDIGLVDSREDVDFLAQVGSDNEELGGLESGGECLARIDFSIDDDAVDGRGDLAILQVGSRILQRCFRRVDGALGDFELCFEGHASESILVHLGVGEIVYVNLSQFVRSFFVVDRLLKLCLDSSDIGFASQQGCFISGHVGFEQPPIDDRQQLARLDFVVEVDETFLDGARHERPDDDLEDRLDRSRRVHFVDDIAASDFFRFPLRGVASFPILHRRAVSGGSASGNAEQEHDQDHPAFHECLRTSKLESTQGGSSRYESPLADICGDTLGAVAWFRGRASLKGRRTQQPPDYPYYGCLRLAAKRATLISLVIVLAGGWLEAVEPLEKLAGQVEFRRPVAVTVWGDQVIVANRNSGSLSVIDAARHTLEGEYRIGARPTDVTALSDGDRGLLAVVCNGDRELVIVARHGEGLGELVRLPTPVDPLRVVGDGRNRLAVTCRWSRSVALYARDASGSWEIHRTVLLPFAPRAVCFGPRREHVIVADAFGGNLATIPWEGNGRVVFRRIEGHGIGGLAVARESRRLLIAHQSLQQHVPTLEQRIFWGNVMNNFLRAVDWPELGVGRRSGAGVGLGESESRALRQWYLFPLGEPGHGTGDPTAVSVSPGGATLVALGGVDEVALWPASGRLMLRLPTGRYPADVAGSTDGRWAFVCNRFDDSVTVVDFVERRVATTIELGTMPAWGAIERGEALFHDARLSHDGWYSCQSCHTDGHTNNLLNDNLGDGDYGSPKRIPSLLGVGRTGPWAWRGNRQRLAELVKRSVEQTMRGHRSLASSANVSDIVAYLRTLDPPPGIAVARGRLKPGLVRRGMRVFEDRGCVDCHRPPEYTTAETYDIGMSDAAGRTEFNPPGLRGVSQRDSFFHDGRAGSLEEVLQRHGGVDLQGLPDADRRALLHLLETL